MATHAQVIPANRVLAAQAFGVCADRLDAVTLASRGDAFFLTTGTAAGFFCLTVERGAAWVHAAAGQGGGLIGQGIPAVERIARERGARCMGFETRRRGLVKLARRLGYQATAIDGGGYKLERKIV